jgi:hypothetical protein
VKLAEQTSDLPGRRVGPRQRLGTFAVNEFKLFSAIGRKATAHRSRCRTKANGPRVLEQRNDGAALWFRRAKDDVNLSTHGRARASFQRPSDLSLTPRYLHDARSDDIANLGRAHRHWVPGRSHGLIAHLNRRAGFVKSRFTQYVALTTASSLAQRRPPRRARRRLEQAR